MIDEADYVLLDHAVLVDHEHVIALSATSFTKDYIVEKEYVESLKFECLDSKIDGTIDHLNATKDVTFDQFMQ